VGNVFYVVLIEVDIFRGLEGFNATDVDRNVIFLEYNSWHIAIVWQTVIGYPSTITALIRLWLPSKIFLCLLTSSPAWRVLYALSFWSVCRNAGRTF